MNAIEITVIIACVLIVAGIIVSGIINKKKGKSSCGCCNGCPYLLTDACDAGYDNADYFAQFEDDDLFMKR